MASSRSLECGPWNTVCKCGCGQQPLLSDYTDVAKGLVKGKPRHFVHGHHLKNTSGSRPVNGKGFWHYVEKSAGCWLWIGGKNKKGYGVYLDFKAHRVAYELVKGSIPSGLTIDHLCRNKACVNPDHLEPVSNQENCKRAAFAKTTCKKGHLWETNTFYYTGYTRRWCKACVLENSRVQIEKKKIARQQNRDTANMSACPSSQT